MTTSHDSARHRRVMIIGLDGATWLLARPWAEAGHLPTFRRLMDEGAWGVLESVVPPSTPVAWSSFATGMYPGKHGLFDFISRRDGSYDTYTVNATHRGGRALWQLLGDAGRRVTIFNVPLSYPPDRVNGLMVSGFLTPAHATDASWPVELQAELQQAVPSFTFYPPNVYAPGHEAEFAEAIAALNQSTLEAARYLLKRQPWDLFMAVFMGTDIIQHFMWEHMERGDDKFGGAILRCYQQIDAILAELVEDLDDDDYLLLMSDHGFGPLTHYFHVNAWLVERGYLRFKRTPLAILKYLGYRLGLTPLGVYQKMLALGLRDRIQETASERNEWMKELMKKVFLSLPDVDWSRTRAYSMGFGGPIFVNLRGREPEGIVQPGAEYEALLEEISRDLCAIVDPYTGEPFVGEIFRAEELFPGPHTGRAPDLMFAPRDLSRQGFGTHEFASNRWLELCYDRSGTHRMDGLLLLRGPGVRPGAQISDAAIVDVAPTVLALQGVPIPDNMDGKVLSAAFEDRWLETLNVTYRDGGAIAVVGRDVPEMSREDQELLERQLRSLGYIG